MSVDRDLFERLETLAEGGRYKVSAYVWVLRLVDEARRRLDRDGHINASDLLESHRELALREFGPMALDVFRHWGVETSRDIGRIVFDLVGGGLLSKTEDDKPEDFEEGYDFHEVFVERYPW